MLKLSGGNIAVVAPGIPWTHPDAIAIDAAGNAYISDWSCVIRKVALTTGTATTIAGNGTCGVSSGDGGPASAATFYYLSSLAVDPAGNLSIGDNNRVREMIAATGIITTVAGGAIYGSNGDGVPATQAGLGTITAVALDSAGNLYIADEENCRVRKVAFNTGTISTVDRKSDGSGISRD